MLRTNMVPAGRNSRSDDGGGNRHRPQLGVGAVLRPGPRLDPPLEGRPAVQPHSIVLGDSDARPGTVHPLEDLEQAWSGIL
jgi:hypothetical protein